MSGFNYIDMFHGKIMKQMGCILSHTKNNEVIQLLDITTLTPLSILGGALEDGDLVYVWVPIKIVAFVFLAFNVLFFV